jgi:hypothetical protein
MFQICKQEDGRYIVVRDGRVIVAGPYDSLAFARRSYPNADCGSGVTVLEWETSNPSR